MSDTKEVLDRNSLYELVWSEPVSVLAKRYGLSDVGFAKICKGMGIPLPGRGHWARVQAGKSSTRPALPRIRNNQTESAVLSKLDERERESVAKEKRAAAKMKQSISENSFPTQLADPHPLAQAALSRLREKKDWGNPKALRSAPDSILNLEVTVESIDRAILIADFLLKELEKRSVSITIDSKNKQTLLIACGTSVEFSITEHVRRTRHEITPEEKRAQDRYWNRTDWRSSGTPPHIPQFDYHPTGELTVTAGRWPSRNWRDTKTTPLEKRLPEIVVGILTVAKATYQREQEAAKQEAARQQVKALYAAAMQRRAEERRAFTQLRKETRNWVLANQIRDYVGAMESQVAQHGPATERFIDWASWARWKADCIDQRVIASDLIVDSPEPEKPNFWW